jgi:hypothetical protein
MEAILTHPERVIPEQIDGEPVTLEDRHLCKTALDAVRDHPALKDPGRVGYALFIEHQVEIGRWCGLEPGECWGTADLGLVRPGEIEVIDFKFGQHPVEPDGLQLKAYALGLAGEIVDQSTRQFLPEYRQTRTVRLTIVQPTLPEVKKTMVFKLDAIEDWMKEITGVLRAASAPNPPRTPGEKQCKFCAFADRCPERRQQIVGAFEMLGDEETVVTDVPGAPEPIASVDTIERLADVHMTQPVEELSPDQIGRLLDLAPLIEGYFKDVRKLATKRLEVGDPVEGWKLVAGKRSREWQGDEDQIVSELKKMSLSVAEIYTRKLISPAQAEKVEKIAKSNKRKHRLTELWEYKEGRPTLAPESDPAPALRAASEMFEDVNEDPAPQPAEDPLDAWLQS